MIKIFQFLLHGCWHRWELQGKGDLLIKGTIVGQYYQYKCSKCNRIEDRKSI